jgi:hypothetical protein
MPEEEISRSQIVTSKTLGTTQHASRARKEAVIIEANDGTREPRP